MAGCHDEKRIANKLGAKIVLRGRSLVARLARKMIVVKRDGTGA
jgi:hypothetical protein